MFPNISGLKVCGRGGQRVVNPIGVEEGARDIRIDGKVHVLRNIAYSPCHFDGIELPNHHAHHVTAAVEERTTAVARLNGRGDQEQFVPVPGCATLSDTSRAWP
jgi:hypothetical protein